MNFFVVFTGLIFLLVFVIAFNFGVPDADDVELDGDPTIRAGEGENCKNPLQTLSCGDGLICYILPWEENTGFCIRQDEASDPEFDFNIWLDNRKIMQDKKDEEKRLLEKS